MEDKKFFEAFPTVELGNDLKGVFADAVVYHIGMNSQRTCVKIYAKFTRLIGRDVLSKVEKEIKRQVKPFFGMEVKILERFSLSSLHTVATILDEYKESMLFELSNHNMILCQLLREAKINTFEDGSVVFELKDNFVSREYANEFKEIIETMMVERFDRELEIRFEYVKAEESRQSKEAEYRISQMVDETSKRIASARKKEDDKPKEETKKPAPKQEKKPFNAGESKPAYRPVKNSDNPDVVYGRDILDDVITLDGVVHEMGEIVFRGMIMAVENRELRNGKIILMFDITDFMDSITVKIFLTAEQYQDLAGSIKKGEFYKLSIS